jgi:lysozyme family protein
MAKYSYESVVNDYKVRWDNMVIHGSRLPNIEKQANLILKGKDVYKDLEAKTNVPWYFIGLLHLRESACDFTKHLHNGDSLQRKTWRVPAGRPLNGSGPFTFEESAIDALKMKNLHKVTNWTVEKIAYHSEIFNGFGYRQNGVPSAYLWAGSNQYVKGKYIRDHVFDPNVVDSQQGCMPVLKVLLEKSGETVPEEDETIIAVEAPKAIPEPPTNKHMRTVSRKFWWNDIAKWFGWGGAATTGIYKAASTLDLDTTKTTLQTVSEIATVVGSFGLIALCIGLVIFTMYQGSLMKQDVQEGRATPSGEANGNSIPDTR